MKTETAKQRLPSFVSHPNGIVLRVLKRQRSMIQTDQRRVLAKQRSSPSYSPPSSSLVPSFICHPNGIVLRVLNQKQSRIQPPSCGVAISIRNHKISASSLSSSAAAAAAATSMVKMEMEMQTDQNGVEQRVKQLKRVKQCVD